MSAAAGPGLWATGALVLVGAGVADAAARSWRLLLRPVATTGILTGMIRQAGASTLGVLLWTAGCVVVWRTDVGGTAAVVPHAGAVAGALWPLLLVVLARMPVAGRPVLLLLHLLAIAHVAAAAPPGTAPTVAAGAALLGYAAFVICRAALAPPAPAAAVPLHLAPRLLRSARSHRRAG